MEFVINNSINKKWVDIEEHLCNCDHCEMNWCKVACCNCWYTLIDFDENVYFSDAKERIKKEKKCKKCWNDLVFDVEKEESKLSKYVLT